MYIERRRFLKGTAAAVPAMLFGCGEPPEGEAESQTSGLALTSEQQFGNFGGDGKKENCGKLCEGFSAPPFPHAAHGGIDESEKKKGRLRKVIIRSGKYIDGMDFLWQDLDTGAIVPNLRHYGGWGGGRNDSTDLVLAPDELIIRAEVRWYKFVDHLIFETNKGQRKHWGTAKWYSKLDVVEVPEGHGIHGFSGIHGHLIDAISLWSYQIA